MGEVLVLQSMCQICECSMDVCARIVKYEANLLPWVTTQGYVFQELIEGLCGHSALMQLMMDQSIGYVDSKCHCEIWSSPSLYYTLTVRSPRPARPGVCFVHRFIPASSMCLKLKRWEFWSSHVVKSRLGVFVLQSFFLPVHLLAFFMVISWTFSKLLIADGVTCGALGSRSLNSWFIIIKYAGCSLTISMAELTMSSFSLTDRTPPH